jgi:hypothetical protein
MPAPWLVHLQDGWEYVIKFGANADLDAADGEILVWQFGTAYPYQTSAQSLEVVSSDANDTSAGSGAQQVLIQGLDGDYNKIQEVVIMNDLTPVTTANQYLRIFRMRVAVAGSGAENAGNVDVRLTGGGDVLGRMSAGEGTTELALYTIPANHTGYITGASFTTDAAAGANVLIRLRARLFGTGAWNVVNRRAVNRQFELKPQTAYYNKIPARTDLAVTAETASNNVEIDASFEILVVPD